MGGAVEDIRPFGHVVLLQEHRTEIGMSHTALHTLRSVCSESTMMGTDKLHRIDNSFGVRVCQLDHVVRRTSPLLANTLLMHVARLLGRFRDTSYASGNNFTSFNIAHSVKACAIHLCYLELRIQRCQRSPDVYCQVTPRTSGFPTVVTLEVARIGDV